MARKRNDDPSGQSWATFLRNHTPQIAAMDLFVVPTIGFNLVYALIIVRLARRKLVWVNVTAHPTAEWIARQITEAFPWNEAPRYLIRDRDRIYGTVVRCRLRATGIRDKPISPGSPWQNCPHWVRQLRKASSLQFQHCSHAVLDRTQVGTRQLAIAPGQPTLINRPHLVAHCDALVSC
jgi:hypothetical protein